MKKNTEIIVDDNGIEIAVGYLYEESPSQIEEGHGLHEVGEMVYTEISSVQVCIKGSPVEILDRMNDRQKKYIINLLSYE